MKCVILAAGKGTRMGELSKDRPKHLIEIAGKPFLYHLISNIKQAGIDEIAVIASYRKEMIEDFIQSNFPEVKILYQDQPLGTGHAPRVAKEFVGKDNFILVMGDNFYSSGDIQALCHIEGNVLAGYRVDDPSRYGVLEVEGNKLIRIIEKPDNPPSDLINTGLYRFTPEIFDALEKIELSPRGEYELPDAITILMKTRDIHVYDLKDYWLDFGKPEDVPILEKFLSA